MGEAKKCPCCGAELGECCNGACLECWFMCNGEHLDRILLAPEGVREAVVVERDDLLEVLFAGPGSLEAGARLLGIAQGSIPSGPQPERGEG